MRIALDVMGGDRGPDEIIRGALLAVDEFDLETILLGPREVVEKGLTSAACTESQRKRIHIEHASQAVGMDESPVVAIRKKKDSTIMVGFDLVKQGRADALVSAGNSGATMAAGIKKLGRLKNVMRPGIAGIFPTLKTPVIIMDVGANVECRPQYLVQFAVMAAACANVLFHKQSPKVGLLSIGEEAGKGNTLIKETHDLLKQSFLNYEGNVEGRDVFQGEVDVIVCDGFVGNICLKISEGLAEAAMKMLGQEIRKSLAAQVGYLLARKAFRDFKKRVDYAEYGGAPLLGINGIAIISHGKSTALAIKNAIKVAAEMVDHRVNDSIVTTLARNTLRQ